VAALASIDINPMPTLLRVNRFVVHLIQYQYIAIANSVWRQTDPGQAALGGESLVATII